VEEDGNESSDLEHLMHSIDNSTLLKLTSSDTTVYPDLTEVKGTSGGDELQLKQQRNLEVMLVARLRTIQGKGH
jgi:hypothetical protein